MALEISKEVRLILITGAGGGLGRYVTAEMEAQGRPGIAVIRSAVSTPRGKVSFFTGDLRNQEWLETLFQDFSFQTVVHLAWKREGGLVRHRRTDGENLQLTRNLLELCRHYQVPGFVFASSLNAGLPNKNQYAWEKEETEKMIGASDIPHKIIYRLSSLFGVGVQAYWNSLTRSVMKRKTVFLLGEKPLTFQPLYAQEAARVILEEREGGTYYLVGPEIWSDEDLIQTMGRIRQIKLQGIRIPLKMLSMLLTPGAKFIRPLKLIQEEIKALNQDKTYLGPEAIKGTYPYQAYLKKIAEGELSYEK